MISPATTDGSLAALRRLVRLARVPPLAALDPEALSALAARATDVPARWGVPLLPTRGAIRILSRGADLGVSPGTKVTSRAPELVPWLAGGPEARPPVPFEGESVIELPCDALDAVLRNDFSACLALGAVLANQVVERERAPGVAARLVTTMERRLEVPEPRLDLTARALALRASMPFAHAHVGLMFQLARETAELRPDDGAELWRLRDAPDQVLLVLAGAIRARAAEQELFVARAGAVIGVFEALARRPRGYRAVAADSLVALSLPIDRLLDILEDQSVFTDALLGMLARAVVMTEGESAAEAPLVHPLVRG